jgi:hypothetical protein
MISTLTLAANARTASGMPNRKEPELDPIEQFKRFKEAADAAGLTDFEAEFERVFEVILKPAPKKPGRKSQSDRS